jgi:hypothetical protein
MTYEEIDDLGKKRGTNAWIKVFLGGLVAFFASLFILVLTGNPNLFPTVVLVGNALVPVTYVVFFYERSYLSRLLLPTIGFAFLYGGLLGVLAAALLEPFFIRRLDLGSVLWIGLIEEGAKILGVIVIARRLASRSGMDGLILGAAVGMGFAVLESIGYTFTAFLIKRRQPECQRRDHAGPWDFFSVWAWHVDGYPGQRAFPRERREPLPAERERDPGILRRCVTACPLGRTSAHRCIPLRLRFGCVHYSNDHWRSRILYSLASLAYGQTYPDRSVESNGYIHTSPDLAVIHSNLEERS